MVPYWKAGFAYQLISREASAPGYLARLFVLPTRENSRTYRQQWPLCRKPSQARWPLPLKTTGLL
jgi:hypothetical protein